MQSILNILKVVLFLLLSETIQCADYSSFTKCSELPKLVFNYQEMIKLSPFTTFASLNQIYQCSQNVYTNPSVTNSSYTYSVINTQMNPVGFSTTDVVLSSDNVNATITYCKSGTTQTVNALESNLSEGNSYHCLYQCSTTNPAIFQAFLCMGRTSSDQQAVASIVDSLENLFTSSQVTVVRAPASGCASGNYCPLF